MALTRSSSLDRVSLFIARLNDEKFNSVRCRLREWYQEASAKTGTGRTQLEVNSCFAPLFKWVLSLFPPECQCLSLALDATNVKQRFTVLTINVLYRGCAIPVAWKALTGNQKGSWKPHWQQLLSGLAGVVPSKMKVIVCADRGLYADWLYEDIIELGWHPFLRINHQGSFRYQNQSTWLPLASLVPRPGKSWSGQIQCFKTSPIDCTILGRWESGYTDPMLIVTDLLPSEADSLWYGLRSWIECGYRDIKSDGMQWHKTRLTDPRRAERHWLAMAVATLWIVTRGGEIDRGTAEYFFEKLSPNQSAQKCPPQSKPTRRLSCFLKGLLTLLADLLNGKPIGMGRLLPEPWPFKPARLSTNTS